MKEKTINVTPQQVECVGDGEGFMLVFYDHRKRVILHFERFWMAILVARLWERVEAWRKMQADLEATVRNRVGR